MGLVLSPGQWAKLEAAVTRRPRGLFTDIDGTISRLAPTPEAAVLLPGVRELLREACAVLDLVVAVSGRGALDARRLVGLEDVVYIGNHGIERVVPHGDVDGETLWVHPAARQYMGAIEAVVARVELAVCERFPGTHVERKGATASIHYRNVAKPSEAEAGILTALAELGERSDVRITQGKMVIELRPPVHVDKGTAVAGVLRRACLGGVMYLGDDRTDVDAFNALRRLTAEDSCAAVAIAVAHAEAPAELAEEADVVLPGIDHVPALLAWVIQHAAG
jgi:trehalose 6-phosphate phosphatase